MPFDTKFPVPHHVGIRAFGDALEENFDEAYLDFLHVTQLQMPAEEQVFSRSAFYLRKPTFCEAGHHELRDVEMESEKEGQHHAEPHIPITSPPQRIQEYSLKAVFIQIWRLNGRNGRDAKLQNLPDEIETTLIDFADDMLGYGYDELAPGAVVDFGNSAFYASLGVDETERRQNFDQASREKMRWRPQLFKAVQFALRDIRSYTYKELKWIPNLRQSKKVVEQSIDDGAVTGDDDDLFIADE